MTGCTRCEDTGWVAWFGSIGKDAHQGPCPKCRPLAAAQLTQIHRERTWPPSAIRYPCATALTQGA